MVVDLPDIGLNFGLLRFDFRQARRDVGIEAHRDFSRDWPLAARKHDLVVPLKPEARQNQL